MRAVWRSVLLACAVCAAQAAEVRIPSIGCLAVGQSGQIAAPENSVITLALNESDGERLAYYTTADDLGVLAPRGWHCLDVYGSGGAMLFVAPAPFDAAELFRADGKLLRGNIIVAARISGENSGRFQVAEIISRMFPEYRAIAERAEREGLTPPFAKRPFPHDRLRYRSRNALRYRTPPRREGLGTFGLIKPAALPIDGSVLILGELPNALHLAVRLPADLAQLTAAIRAQFERDALRRRY